MARTYNCNIVFGCGDGALLDNRKAIIQSMNSQYAGQNLFFGNSHKCILKVKNKIIAEIKEFDHFSVTTDLWSSVNMIASCKEYALRILIYFLHLLRLCTENVLTVSVICTIVSRTICSLFLQSCYCQ